MNIGTLQKIKSIENYRTLEILVYNLQNNISFNAFLTLSNFGRVTIVVNNDMLKAELEAKICGYKNIRVVTINRFPTIQYDIYISTFIDNVSLNLIKFLNIKYILFFNKVENLNLNDYIEFDENAFHHSSIQMPVQKKIEKPIVVPPKTQATQPKPKIEKPVEVKKKTDKFDVNYLNNSVPGKVSIIMIVSELNNKFAETVRRMKAQKVASVEYIIVDNAAGFRNNVKPNIRYGDKMPEDYCKARAKELCTGEYIMTLNQNSDEIDILDYIMENKYESR